MTRIVNHTSDLWKYTNTTDENLGLGLTDSVVVIAVLKRHLMFDCLLLLKQYRPSLRAYTLEFPIGIVNANESAEAAALREVERVTGYHGTVKKVGEVTAFDAGLSNNKVRLVSLNIFASKEHRNSAKQHQNEEDEIEVIPLPIEGLHNRLDDFTREGVIIDSRVEMYAMGLSTSSKPEKFTSPVNI